MSAGTAWGGFDTRRRSNLVAELRTALSGMSDEELRAWAGNTVKIAGTVSLRRGTNLKEGLLSLYRAGKAEWKAAHHAWKANESGYIRKRSGEIIGNTVEFVEHGKEICVQFASRVANNPKQEAPVLVAGVVGFLMGSGGLDGDGGIPDLDLLGGIGAHRSLLTHTIVAGIVAETLIRSTADLAQRVHNQLPQPHDPFWDVLAVGDSRVIEALCAGTSLGLGYHFAVDATVDATGSYAALKGVIGANVDNAFQAANALTEGIHGIRQASLAAPAGLCAACWEKRIAAPIGGPTCKCATTPA